MCGIFGIIAAEGARIDLSQLNNLILTLFTLSESRGSDAAGLAMLVHGEIHGAKEPIKASRFVHSPTYKSLLKHLVGSDGTASIPLAIIGHSRLATNGHQGCSDNNQPVFRPPITLVHNGIIVNAEQLWQDMPGETRQGNLDSEALAAWMLHHQAQEQGDKAAATSLAWETIHGTASVAALWLGEHNHCLLATNNGSLYVLHVPGANILVFASEHYILHALRRQRRFQNLFRDTPIQQLRPEQGWLYRVETLEGLPVPLPAPQTPVAPIPLTIIDSLYRHAEKLTPSEEKILNMRRCTRCILPETVPFIQFDEQGVCNYCNHYKPIQLKDPEEVLRIVRQNRQKSLTADCLVAFSGGRDSCYGLHLLKTQYGLNPVAYTYDWGMTNDLARRNQARICGKLGIEHIVVSANLARKRENIKNYLEAWLKQPRLSMIPLFTAGDKHFYYYAQRLAKRLSIGVQVFCVCKLERTHFKWGFGGIPPELDKNRPPYQLNLSTRLRMGAHFAGCLMRNPAYFNYGLLDSFTGFLAYYIQDQTQHVSLFDYLPWEEQEVQRVLVEEYGWEFSSDTPSSWRIGDGTAPLYNYIYYTVAGFTEFDTFRSNQIRENQMTRSEAMAKIIVDNRPRMQSLLEYAELINVDLHKFLKIVDAMPKLYESRT